jgi:UDP-galactopyranose mutase
MSHVPRVKRAHPDLLCFSHLRWGFVYQRPQHLLSRFARQARVFFFEEPVLGDDPEPRLEASSGAPGVTVLRPVLPAGLDVRQREPEQARLLDQLLRDHEIRDYVCWYYTPLAMRFTAELEPRAVVYDCMDELSAFEGAASDMRQRERELLARADLVFTGGRSLYEAKRSLHPSVHAFPSSVDVDHFRRARSVAKGDEPEDQARLPRPRVGYAGVIDERIDLELVEFLARTRPDWQLVFVGPVVKIDPGRLPRRPNIHYLGQKPYESLPLYLSGWDVAVLPFARNAATRFISPTKTPEYLAAGRPVVSTPIRDVVRPYGELGIVRIAGQPADFERAVDGAMRHDAGNLGLSRAVEAVLRDMSWERTWAGMNELLSDRLKPPSGPRGASSLARAGELRP